MAEQDANRDEGLDPDEPAAEPGHGAQDSGGAPAAEAVERPGAAGDAVPEFDEEAAWAAIVAGYGEEPPDPPGAKPFKSVEDLALLDPEQNEEPAPPKPGKTEKPGEPEEPDRKPDGKRGAGRPAGGDGALGDSVTFAPGVGPRDFAPARPSDDDFDADDEGHFMPPEPPPLPSPDVTSRFAWLAVVGGPILLLLAVLLGWPMTWWLTTLGVGGFVGGFITLVVRMRTDEEDDDDPGRGAVV
ncbi:hypothetical protein [Streptomyces sp. NPDC050560]|uniref:hypothetical protein n=1 Tax=Streptomyces sp. NPDC050560 TaxID=3365630 RepID=UPI00378864D5